MVVLATKIYVDGDARDRALDGLDSLISNQIGALQVSYEIGIRHDEFPAVTVTGEDAIAARNVLRERWGEITPTIDPGEEYVGTLEAWDEDGFVIDVGSDVRVSRDHLGLGPGTPSQLRERFGLVQHLRMRVLNADPPRLADRTRDMLYDWSRGSGRVNVNSVTRSEVRATINRAGHAHDIVTIERLGLLEQSIVCADGTDPPGLVASIGNYLPAELRCVIP